MFIISMYDSTNQCKQYKLNIVNKYDSRNTKVSLFFKKIMFMASRDLELVKTFPFMYHSVLKDWYWWSQGDFNSSVQVKIQFDLF